MNVDGFNIIIGVAGVLVAIGGVLAATLPGRTLRKGQTAREAFALVRDLEEFDQRASARLEGAEFERDASTRTNRAQLLESVRAAALISAHDFAESAKRAGVPYSFSVFLFVYGGSICAVARFNNQIPPPPTSGPLFWLGVILLAVGFAMFTHRLLRRTRMKLAGVPLVSNFEALRETATLIKTRLAIRRAKRLLANSTVQLR